VPLTVEPAVVTVREVVPVGVLGEIATDEMLDKVGLFFVGVIVALRLTVPVKPPKL